MEEKLKMSIFDYYQNLSRNKKSAFIKNVSVRCDICAATIFYKIKKDSWTKLEREAVEKIINDDREH